MSTAARSGLDLRVYSTKDVNKHEAKEVLAAHLSPLRTLTYDELRSRFLHKVEAFETTAPSGVVYQLELQGFWDGKRGGDLRILGLIDDGGWRAYKPLSDSFIIAPDNTFVGED